MSTLTTQKRQHCPICHSTDAQRVFGCLASEEPIKSFLSWRHPRHDPALLMNFEVSIMKCRECYGLYHENIIADFYASTGGWRDTPEVLWEKQKQKMQSNLATSTYREVKWVKKLLGHNPSEQTIMDFGAGWGFWCQMAKALGFRALAAEVDEIKRQHLTQNGIELANLDQSQSLCLDFINTQMVFEHLPTPLEQLKQLAFHLNKGGLIRINVPDASNIEKALTKENSWMTKDSNDPNYLNAIWLFGHINAYTPKALETLAEKAGLKPLTLSSWDYMKSQRDVIPPEKLFSETRRVTGKKTERFFQKTNK